MRPLTSTTPFVTKGMEANPTAQGPLPLHQVLTTTQAKPVSSNTIISSLKRLISSDAFWLVNPVLIGAVSGVAVMGIVGCVIATVAASPISPLAIPIAILLGLVLIFGVGYTANDCLNWLREKSM